MNSTEVSLSVGVIGGLLTFIALFLAVLQTRQLSKSIARLESTEKELLKAQESIASLSSEMYSVLGLARDARNTPGLFDSMGHVIANVSQLTTTPGYIADRVQQALNELVTVSVQANAGSFEIKYSDLTEVAFELIECTSDGDEIFATSYVDTAEFWEKNSAKRYLSRSQELISERGIHITRVFLFADEAQYDESKAEMAKHAQAGISVRYAFTGKLEPDLTKDLFLLNNTLSAEYDLAQGRADILGVRIHSSPHPEVGNCERRRRKLVASSELFKEDSER